MAEIGGGDGELEGCIGPAGPPGPEDSLKYACMGRGYSLRPVRVGQKGRRYCLRCSTERCIHGGAVRERQAVIRRQYRLQEMGEVKPRWNVRGVRRGRVSGVR